MKKISLSLCLLLLFQGAALALELPNPVTPADIRKAYYSASPIEIVDALHSEGSYDFDMILRQIASGDGDWLAVTPLLRAGADSNTATAIDVALAEAIKHNPSGVLGLGVQTSLARACSIPFKSPSDEFVQSYYVSALKSLETVNDSNLEMEKKVCSIRLDAAYKEWENIQQGQK